MVWLHVVLLAPAMLAAIFHNLYFAAKKRKQTDKSIQALEDFRFMIVNSSKATLKDTTIYSEYCEAITTVYTRTAPNKAGYMTCK